MTIAIVASPTRTNVQLVDAWRALGVDALVASPEEALRRLRRGDAALFRLDVLPTLDGVEPGLEAAAVLEDRGVRILNRPAALLATHDKLATARILGAAGLPHPRTLHVSSDARPTGLTFPCVVKPRFGSWGEDVHLCATARDFDRTLRSIRDRAWWLRHGALAQELVAPVAHDLRLVVAGDLVVAAARRTAAPGEWRTNVSLGGRVAPTEVEDEARRLAIRAAQAIGVDLVGVDLLPAGESWTVLELNGAVDFDRGYALPGLDPYEAVLRALRLPGREELPVPTTRKEHVMSKTIQGAPPRAGDEIVITGHAVGDAPRTALILDVLGEAGHERFRVRWEDGHESIFFPGEDAIVRRPHARAAARA